MNTSRRMNKKMLKRKRCNRRRQSKTWNIIHEDGREVIQQWRDKRIRLRGARKSYREMLVYSFNMDTLRSFLQNINFMVILQMIIAVLAVYIFQEGDIYCYIPINLFVAPIVFPLAFSINTDFQRREKVLEDLASFKSSGMIWYFCMREWKEAAGLDDDWMTAAHAKLKSLIFHLHEYLLTYKPDRRKLILGVMYEDFSDASQLIEKVRSSKLPANPAIVSKAVSLIHIMCSSFERLRVVREYRSPRSIRSFNKVFITLLPIILAPYFVYLEKNKKDPGTPWQPYYIAVVVAFVFSCLQGVQDKLDDPFDGMSEDDVNLDMIDEWVNGSLVHIMGRILRIGGHQTTFVDENEPSTIYSGSFPHKTDICNEILNQEKHKTSETSISEKQYDSIDSKSEPLVQQLVSSVLSRMKSSPRIPKRSLDSQLKRFKEQKFVQDSGKDLSSAILNSTPSLNFDNLHSAVKKTRSLIYCNENVAYTGKRVSFAEQARNNDDISVISTCSSSANTVTNIQEPNVESTRDVCIEIFDPVNNSSDRNRVVQIPKGNREQWLVEIDTSDSPAPNIAETCSVDITSDAAFDRDRPCIGKKAMNGEQVKLDIQERDYADDTFLENTFDKNIGFTNNNERYDSIQGDCDVKLSKQKKSISKHISSSPLANGWTPLNPT